MHSFSFCVPCIRILKAEIAILIFSLVKGVIFKDKNVVEFLPLFDIYSCALLSRMTVKLLDVLASDPTSVEAVFLL